MPHAFSDIPPWTHSGDKDLWLRMIIAITRHACYCREVIYFSQGWVKNSKALSRRSAQKVRIDSDSFGLLHRDSSVLYQCTFHEAYIGRFVSQLITIAPNVQPKSMCLM